MKVSNEEWMCIKIPGTAVVVLRGCPSINILLVFMVCGQGIFKPGQGKVMEKSGNFFLGNSENPEEFS